MNIEEKWVDALHDKAMAYRNASVAEAPRAFGQLLRFIVETTTPDIAIQAEPSPSDTVWCSRCDATVTKQGFCPNVLCPRYP
jgi:hypothetical protein